MASVHVAAELNDVKALARLLDADPGQAETAQYKWPGARPLHIACEEGSVEAALLLIDRGAVIDIQNLEGLTPLMLACRAGEARVVAMLLARGADPTLRCPTRTTALMYASCYDYRERRSDRVAVIRRLLEDGRVPIDAVDEDGRTALWYACDDGSAERAGVLLIEGMADHTIADHDGITALAVAREEENEECVRLIEWYEGEEGGAHPKKPFLLCKARAVVDDVECMAKAAEMVKVNVALMEAAAPEPPQYRQKATPAYLRGRLESGRALPRLKMVGQGVIKYSQRAVAVEEEARAVVEYVVRWLKADLFVELMEGMRLRTLGLQPI